MLHPQRVDRLLLPNIKGRGDVMAAFGPSFEMSRCACELLRTSACGGLATVIPFMQAEHRAFLELG